MKIFRFSPTYFQLAAALTLLMAATPDKVAVAQTASYDRPTVNFILLTHGDGYDAATLKAFQKIPAEEKFYSNKLNTSEAKLPQMPRSNASPTAWQVVQAELTRQNVAKQEVVAWYLRKPDGGMSMDLIHRRGEINATDEAFLMANATKRGVDELKDLGRKLISKTYVVALDYSNVSYSANAETDIHSWKATMRAMVFKLKFNGEVENSIYEAWPDEQDSPEALSEKNSRFDQIPFELEFVAQSGVNISASALITGKSSGKQSGIQSLATLTLRKTSREDLLDEMLLTGYGSMMNELEKKVAAFKVQSGVWELDPIRAKIGKKEGLKTDQRYYVLEYEQNSRGQLKAVRKAVVRVADDITDNRAMATGKSEASKFYQIAGRRVEKGMTLEQRNDAGIGLLLGYDPGVGGAEKWLLRAEILTNRFINLGIWPGLYLYVEGEMEPTSYALTDKFANDYAIAQSGDKSSYLFTRANVGLGKGFYFWRNFSLSPYVGFGWEAVSVSSSLSLESFCYKAGANLTVNIYYPLQLVGGVSGLTYGKPTLKNSDDSSNATTTDTPQKYSDIFSGRSSGIVSGFVGVRINF
ncbi:MAG: hypothetical protein LBJ57_03395 [Prevotellaceae bacterium]|jgi:hypothetical protein|nr:hypothetical protein [Prevotellaceae bacterium]